MLHGIITLYIEVHSSPTKCQLNQSDHNREANSKGCDHSIEVLVSVNPLHVHVHSCMHEVISTNKKINSTRIRTIIQKELY